MRRAMRLQGEMATYKGLAELESLTDVYDVVADPETGDTVVVMGRDVFSQLQDRLAGHGLVEGQGWAEVPLMPISRLKPREQSRLRNWKRA